MYSTQELEQLAAALGGLPVISCAADSPAGRAGVRYGDIVLAVNGVKTPTWPAFIEARALRSDGITIELFRDGANLTLEVTLDPEQPAPAATDVLAEILSRGIVPLDPNAPKKPKPSS